MKLVMVALIGVGAILVALYIQIMSPGTAPVTDSPITVPEASSEPIPEPVVQEPSDPDAVYYATVPVLAYHTIAPYTGEETVDQRRFKIDPAVLDQQFAYLRDNGYTVISIMDLVESLTSGNLLPEKSVVLTFDDGTDTQYKHAVPILEKYGYTATFFIYTIVLGNNKFMTWDQVRELDAKGMTIGGHTKTHAYLTKITDDATLDDEIAGGKQLIEEKLGHEIAVLAYPFYMTNDRVQQAVADAGYLAAFAGWQPGSHSTETLYSLGRVEPSNSMTEFRSLLKYH